MAFLAEPSPISFETRDDPVGVLVLVAEKQAKTPATERIICRFIGSVRAVLAIATITHATNTIERINSEGAQINARPIHRHRRLLRKGRLSAEGKHTNQQQTRDQKPSHSDGFLRRASYSSNCSEQDTRK